MAGPGAAQDGVLPVGIDLPAGMDLVAVVEVLRKAGALFAYVHGSRAAGRHAPDSDLDVAAFFGRAVDPWAVPVPDGVDVLVLDGAPLELAGRVAQHGRLVLEADPVARVRWEATTRKIFLDERPRVEQARRDFAAAHARG